MNNNEIMGNEIVSFEKNKNKSKVLLSLLSIIILIIVSTVIIYFYINSNPLLAIKYNTNKLTKNLTEQIEQQEKIKKVSQGSPNIRDAILNNEVDLIINTSEGKQSAKDGYIIRRLAIELGIPYVTTLAGARAVLNAIKAVQNNEINVKSLNDYVDGE